MIKKFKKILLVSQHYTFLAFYLAYFFTFYNIYSPFTLFAACTCLPAKERGGGPVVYAILVESACY